MWYNFDIIKYAQYVLRPSLRKRKIFAIISIFLLPLIFIYTLFKSYRKQAIDKLNINGQVIYIEKVLNDRFFLKNREIYITDIAGKESHLYYRREEQIPSYLHKRNEGAEIKYIQQRGEGNYSGNFIVNIPFFLAAYESEIKNLVDYYKPAGRSYVLKIYEYE